VSDLEPADPAKGIARIDARSLAIPEPTHDAVPDVVAPVSADQSDPSVEEGQAWVTHAGTESPAKNGLVVTLSGAKSVRLDLRRMRISAREPISVDVTTDRPVTIQLGTRTIQVDKGHHTLTV
jgi:hypothetical protein